MKIWKLKDEHRGPLHPQDLVCVELDGHRLLFIQERGTFDVALADDGLPTEDMWELIADDE